MVSLIRELDESPPHIQGPHIQGPKGPSLLIWMIGLFLTGLIVASAALAALNASELGWPAFILFMGMAMVAAFGAMTLISGRRNARVIDRRFADRDTPYSDAFYKNPEACLIVKDGKPVHANQAYMALANQIGAMGISETAPSVDRLFSGGGKETASAVFRLHHMHGDTPEAEEFIDTLCADGGLKRYRIHVTNLDEVQLWQVTDVTRESYGEESMLVGAPVGLFSASRDGRIIATNSVLDRWLGGIGRVRPDTMSEFIEDAESFLESPPTPGRVVRMDTRLITRKGVVTPTVMVGTWHELDNGEAVASVALYGHSSLGAAKAPAKPAKAPKAAMAPEAGNSFVSAPIAILQLEGIQLGESIIKSANPAFDSMSGGVAWKDLPFAEVFAPDDMETRFLSLTAFECEAGKPFDAIIAGVSELPVNVYIVPDPADTSISWAYLVDVSARKLLEDQLVQSQKMQAIGQLAAGVAHDFNNLLTAIRLNTDELLQRHPVGDPSYPELQNINSTGIRAAALVKQLLTFSRKETRRVERLSVTDTLSDMVMTLKQTIGERVKMNMVHGRGLPPIRADKNQIDRVLLNLCVNARDAMEEQGGGTITIRSSQIARAEIKDKSAALALKSMALKLVPGDNFIVIEVSDTGTGMTDEVKSKIFEPFFTTKDVGKGTGLGLATVYGIVQQTGGHLTVDSNLGVGTTFRIYLPAVDPSEAEQEDEVKAPTPVRKPADLTGQGTILFVEDEASVRLIAAKTLRKRGYKVIEAEDGEEAYEILEEGEHKFDLMISDVVMPGMDGPALLKKGRALLGEARIVFISGYAEEEFSDLLSEEPDVTFLPKPFTLAQLAEKVKEEIGESDGDNDD